MKKVFLILFLGALFLGVFAQKNCWELNGNTGTSPKSDFLGTTDCMPLIFKTNNNERMRLLSDKSFLGIGVLNPNATLHLHLQVDKEPCDPMSANGKNRTLLQLTTTETGNAINNGFSISSLANKEVLFQQHEQENLSIKGPSGGLTIAADGNIGLGTNQPLGKLHIADGGLLISNNISEPSRSSTSIMGIMMGGENIMGRFWGLDYTLDDNNGGLYLSYRENNMLPVIYPRLYIKDNGDIAIGHQNPQARLDIAGDIKADSANIAGTLTTNVLKAQSANIIGTLTANTLNAQNASFSKLGIGITTPQAFLHVHDPRVLTPNKGMPEDSTNTKNVRRLFQLTTQETGSSANDGFRAFYDYNNLYFQQQEQGYLSLETPGGGLMIAPNGNIGMGPGDPKQKLHITDGNILISKTSHKAPQSANGSILFGADINNNFPMGKGVLSI